MKPIHYLVTDELFVAPQITADDVVQFAALGFQTIINNRPDGEEEGQPISADIAQIAAQHGVQYIEIPIVMQTLADKDIDAFAQALKDAPKPIVAFCRTGTRSISMWALAQARILDAAQIIETAQASGYDLLPLLSRIQARTL